MTTIRDIVTRAYRRAALRDASTNLDPIDAVVAIEELREIVLALPGMTHWKDVEATEDYTAGENERIRVNSDEEVTVTVPSAVSSARSILLCCNDFTLVCEGYDDRAPKDGARVQITDTGGTVSATYYYRADAGQWMRADALTMSSAVPLNADMHSGLTAILGERLGSMEPGVPTSPSLVAEAAAARVRMRARYGKRQDVGVDVALLNTSAAFSR